MLGSAASAPTFCELFLIPQWAFGNGAVIESLLLL